MASKIIAVAFLLLDLTYSSAVSLRDQPVYQSQRSCALNCFSIGGYDVDVIAEQLSCDLNPVENECFCRADLQSKADSFIQSCVNRNCNGATVDIVSATSIYDGYCTSAGFSRAAATQATQSTSNESNSLTTSTASPSQTGQISSPTTSASNNGVANTSSNSTQSSGRSGLSTEQIIIISVICGSVVLLGFGSFFWRKHRAQTKQDQYSPRSDQYSSRPDHYSSRPDQYSPRPDITQSSSYLNHDTVQNQAHTQTIYGNVYHQR